jgi:hypothetical protein
VFLRSRFFAAAGGIGEAMGDAFDKYTDGKALSNRLVRVR